MKKKHGISLVITVKNEEQSINKLIDSVEKQTLLPDEILIVDGGSIDKTVEIVERRAKENKRINLLKEENLSISQGRNLAVSNAKYNLIAMTDAGCILKRDWLRNITMPLICNGKTDIVAGAYRMRGQSYFQEAIKPYLGINFFSMRTNNFLPSARSIAFSKRSFKRIGGFPEWLNFTAEDTYFNFIAKKLHLSFVFQKNAIVYWNVPSNLRGFLKKVFNYAKGDAQSKIWWHPTKKFKTHNIKIASIFLRYFTFLVLANLSVKAFLLLVVFYILWAIAKNSQKVKPYRAKLLLPFVQITSDVAVMTGFILGLGKTKNKKR